MKKIKAETLSDMQNYKLLSGSIIPRPIAFVTTQNLKGDINAAPFCFFNVVNHTPPMIAIAVQRTKGNRKDTSINIEQSGEFVVHITDEAIVNDVNETAAPLEYGVNELKRTSLSMIDSDLIKVPAIKEAKVRFECKLHQIVQLGNKDNGSDLIIGEIVVYHIDEEVYFEDSKIDANQLNPVARLAGNDYSLLGQTFTVNRPTS
ncbi:flavin reductase family protein [Staphylococcus epidermidis]|uniref:flavin reductase family protein n=1 Tax=Staphylococcus epidermidis TaxID=1282 RepID=UPI0020B3E0C3|nr:flavin reductase family protein [Staphylococcus epidermidis]UTF56791.1 flavin reductase family protein [Staphylococcus epidermidis]